MAKVICSLPNASTEINGVAFESTDGGMLSVEVTDEVAEAFVAIPGYALVGAVDPAVKAAAEAEKADLLARAAAIEFKVKANWGADRLKIEVEGAEKAAAEAAAKAAE